MLGALTQGTSAVRQALRVEPVNVCMLRSHYRACQEHPAQQDELLAWAMRFFDDDIDKEEKEEDSDQQDEMLAWAMRFFDDQEEENADESEEEEEENADESEQEEELNEYDPAIDDSNLTAMLKLHNSRGNMATLCHLLSVSALCKSH